MTAADDWEEFEEAWAALKRTVLAELKANVPALAFGYVALVAIAYVVGSLT